MEVSSVTSNVNALNVKNATAVQPKNQPAHTREVENDKDKDDGTSKAVAPPLYQYQWPGSRSYH